MTPEAENAKLRVELERAQARLAKLEKLKESRRFHAACAAMQGYRASPLSERHERAQIVKWAMLDADALLAALEES
jgi:mitochondrial fission protein ELM1